MSSPEFFRLQAQDDRQLKAMQEFALLVERARSAPPRLQEAAITALGRLERRDGVPHLLPHLRSRSAETRRAAATAIGQAMRGAPPPGDPAGTSVESVQQVLLAAAASERSGEPMGAMARTLGRLPYRSPAQVAAADAFLRQVLELSQLDKAAAAAARSEASAGVELLARLHPKLFAIPEDTHQALRGIVTAQSHGVQRSDLGLRLAAFRALISARGVDAETLRREVDDAMHPEFRRLSMVSLGGAGSVIIGEDRLHYLRRGMADPDYTVRFEALRAYARHDAKSDGCQPVMDLLADRHEHVAVLAIDTLGNCADDENVVLRLIGEARTPPDRGSWRREAHALVSLARRSPVHAEVPLSSHARHNVWQVRMYAARAAAIASDVPTLERLALDAHDNVREAAIGPLVRLKRQAAEPVLIAALGRSDYQLLRTAAREMAGLEPTVALTAALLDALSRVTAQKKDTSRDTRVAILERLRTFGSARDAEPVARLLRDFDEQVATAAAATLFAWTGRTHEIDPVPLLPEPPPSETELETLTSQTAFLRMESGKEIGIKLDPVNAPIMSTRFLRLARRKYFDGLTFHRVVPNFVIQGGSPGANEYAGDSLFVQDEISSRTHARGTVGLSTRGRNTGDAQFFINLVDNPRLDFEYTVFGEVINDDVPEIDAIMEGDRILSVTFRRRR